MECREKLHNVLVSKSQVNCFICVPRAQFDGMVYSKAGYEQPITTTYSIKLKDLFEEPITIKTPKQEM